MGIFKLFARLTGNRPPDKAELIPVLRVYEPGGVFEDAMVHRPIGANLAIYLAPVGMTPRQTIGLEYLMRHQAQASSTAEDALFDASYANLKKGLRVDAHGGDGGTMLVVRHRLDHGTSALGLPDFYEQAKGWVGSPKLFVGFTDPGSLIVTAMANRPAIEKVQEAVMASDYWGAVYLTPACYCIDANGLQLIAKRPAPESAGGGSEGVQGS